MWKIRRDEDRTSGDCAWRLSLNDDAVDALGERTRSGAVDGAYELAREMLPALEHTVKHPNMIENLAEILSTSAVEIEYEVPTGVAVRD